MEESKKRKKFFDEKMITIIILSSLLIAMTIVSWTQLNNYKDALRKSIDIADRYESDILQLTERTAKLEEKINFYDETIVFVLTNNNFDTGYHYYTYDQMISLKGKDFKEYHAYDKKLAQILGYKPLP